MTIPIARSVPGFSGSPFARQAGRALVLSLAVMVAACGGGGGDGVAVVVVPPVPATTALDGDVAPLGNLAGVTSLTRSDMLLPPNAGAGTFVAIVQNVYSVYDLAAAPQLRLQSLTFRQADVAGTLELRTGAATYANDATLGQLTATATSGPDGSRVSLAVTLDSLDTIGNLQTALYCQSCSAYTFGIVLPFSATANPNGYSFQTFGAWALPFALPGGMLPNIDGDVVENWFSVGIPTVPATLPIAGTATYAGQSGGNFVDAATRDRSDIAATVSATADFAARTVVIATSASTSLSENAATGAARLANSGLNLSGTLTYVNGSNTFSGIVTSASGMTGNATCRFYGAAIGAAAPGKVIGSPPEIGCTFAALNTAVGATYGALGAK